MLGVAIKKMTSRFLRLLLCGALSIFLSSLPSGGSESDAVVRTLTLEEAQELALAHNRDLIRLGYETAKREIDLRVVRRARGPDLDLDFAVAERFGRRFDQSIGKLEDRRSTALDARVQSTIRLFDRSGRASAIAMAERELAAEKERSHWGRQRVLFEVNSLYMDIVLDSVLIGIEREHQQAQQAQLQHIEGFWQSGKRPHSDVLQQRAALARARLRLLDSERQLAMDKLNLKDVLGIEPQTQIELADPNPVGQESALPTYELAPLLESALAARPDIKSLAHSLEASEEAVQRARIHYWPQVDLSVSLGTDYTSLDDDLGLADQLFEGNPRAAVGLYFSTPILDRGVAQGALQRAQVARKEAALELAEKKRAISLALELALLDYDISLQQLQAARQEQLYAQEALKEITVRYDKGMATVAELTQARAQYVEAAGGQAVAKHNVSMRQLALDFLAHTPSAVLTSHVEDTRR
jgi:outer membrane protein